MMMMMMKKKVTSAVKHKPAVLQAGGLIMATLCNIFALWFLSSSIIFYLFFLA